MWMRRAEPMITTMRENLIYLIMCTVIRNAAGMTPMPQPLNMLQKLFDEGMLEWDYGIDSEGAEDLEVQGLKASGR